MSTEHSPIGASSMYRWAACPGSVALSKGLPNTESEYAREGTLAHGIAADCLVNQCDAADHPDCPSDEMAQAIQVYLDECRTWMQEAGENWYAECKFDLSSVHPGCFGTADFVAYVRRKKLLVVLDFKYGAGVLVDAVANPQLEYYALGALLQSGHPAARVRMGIVQPRIATPTGGIRYDTQSVVRLLDFRTELKGYAEATEQKDAPLVPGKHCQFCPAAGVCPALHAEAMKAAAHDFALPQVQEAGIPIDPVMLRQALDSRDLVRAWLTAVDQAAYRLMTSGVKIGGYKLVQKRGTREWKSVTEAGARLEPFGKIVYTAPELLSVAQVEKVVGKKTFKEQYADLFDTVSSGTTIAPESDSRPEAPCGAAGDFAPVEGEVVK